MNNYLTNLAANAEERHLIARIDELARKALQGSETRTDFLDLRQQVLGEAAALQYTDIHWKMDGGFETAERKRLLFFPVWNDHTDSQIQFIWIQPTDKREISLAHRDYLGAILNIGIKREKTGDILVHEREAYAAVDQSLAGYLCQQLDRVGHHRVVATLADPESIKFPSSEPVQLSCTIPSLRLDAVLAAGCRISRSEAAALIESGRVQLNHLVIEKCARPVKEEDLLSVRGIGRLRLDEVEGLSKKGRYRVQISRW